MLGARIIKRLEYTSPTYREVKDSYAILIADIFYSRTVFIIINIF